MMHGAGARRTGTQLVHYTKPLPSCAPQLKDPLLEAQYFTGHDGRARAGTGAGGGGGAGGDEGADAFRLRSYHASDLPKDVMAWCLDLCRETLKPLYERVWTWSDAKKRRQLSAVRQPRQCAGIEKPGTRERQESGGNIPTLHEGARLRQTLHRATIGAWEDNATCAHVPCTSMRYSMPCCPLCMHVA